MMINIAVCDDEPLLLRELTGQISACMAERQRTDYRISGFADGRALLESGGGSDLVFLDIRMTHPDGMETARKLRQRGSRCLLVFVTALEGCVFDAFEVQAFDYLVKPVDGARLGRVLDRALRTLGQVQSLVLQKGNSCEVVRLSDLVYCEVLGRKLYLHQADGTVTDCYGRLETLQKQLDSRFFRCHRSYLVNLDQVRGCGAGRLRLLPEGEIPVSRLRERELVQALLRRMKEREG